jgi:hypothetical protein
VTVDYSRPKYQVNYQTLSSLFTTAYFRADLYNQGVLQVNPFYHNGVFQDFTLSLGLKGLPEQVGDVV